MKTHRLTKIIKLGISLFLAYVLVSFILLMWQSNRYRFYEKRPVLNISKKEAIEKAQQFCDKAGVSCNGEAIFSEGTMSGVRLIDSGVDATAHRIGYVADDHYIGGFVSFDDKSAGNESKVILGLGRRSNEVESYWNEKIFFHLIQKYGRIKTDQFPRGRINYPKFLPEEKAKEIFLSIAQKIEIPPDMLFDRLIKNEEEGIWSAIWLRKKDGYRYEGDGISMSIMGSTGEFISYEKTYRGVDCPTAVNISKDRAMELAWNKLRCNVPWPVIFKVKEVYDVKTDLRIVPVGKYWIDTLPQ